MPFLSISALRKFYPPSRTLFQLPSTEFFGRQPHFRKFEFGELVSDKALKRKEPSQTWKCLFSLQIKGKGLYVCTVFQSMSTHFPF